jgi:hypothetical protein
MADDDDGATTRTTSTASSALHHGNPRSWILQVGGSAGRLCGVANSHLMPNTTGSSTINDTALVLAMTELLLDVFHASESLQLDLSLSIRQKMALNNRKYPVELCKVCTVRRLLHSPLLFELQAECIMHHVSCRRKGAVRNIGF